MFAKKNLFVFDLDGTLFDTLGDLACAVNFALRAYKMPEHDNKTIRTFIGNGSLKLIERAMGKFALQQNAASSCISVNEVHTKFFEFYSKHCTEFTKPNPYIIDFIKKENNMRIAMLTNKPMRPTLSLLKHFGLENRFEQIICGDTAPERKPSPLGLLKIINATNVNVANTVMIGDDTPDIMAASAANVDCVTLLCGYGKAKNLLPLKPKCAVKSYKQLCETLKEML